MKYKMNRTTTLTTISAFILTGLSIGCKTQPDQALCGEYYGKLVQLQESGHPAVSAALKTSGGKSAIMNYCMQLSRYRVECTLNAGSIDGARICETQKPESQIEEYYRKVIPK